MPAPAHGGEDPAAVLVGVAQGPAEVGEVGPAGLAVGREAAQAGAVLGEAQALEGGAELGVGALGDPLVESLTSLLGLGPRRGWGRHAGLQRPLGDGGEAQVGRALAVDGRGDLRAQQAADGVAAGLDGAEIGVVGGDDGDEQGGAAGLGADVDDPQAVELGITKLAGEDEIDAFVDLPAQLGELSLAAAWAGLRGKRRGVG